MVVNIFDKLSKNTFTAKKTSKKHVKPANFRLQKTEKLDSLLNRLCVD